MSAGVLVATTWPTNERSGTSSATRVLIGVSVIVAAAALMAPSPAGCGAGSSIAVTPTAAAPAPGGLLLARLAGYWPGVHAQTYTSSRNMEVRPPAPSLMTLK